MMLAVASHPAELPEEVVRNQCVLGVISVPGRKRIGQCLAFQRGVMFV